MCNELYERGGRGDLIPAAYIAQVTSSAVSGIAVEVVCAVYCSAIRAVCASKDENRGACGVAVVKALLAMVMAHPASVTVLAMACPALALLVANGECFAQLKAGGRAKELLQQAKSAHPDDASVQKWADIGLMRLRELEVCTMQQTVVGACVYASGCCGIPSF